MLKRTIRTHERDTSELYNLLRSPRELLISANIAIMRFVSRLFLFVAGFFPVTTNANNEVIYLFFHAIIGR